MPSPALEALCLRGSFQNHSPVVLPLFLALKVKGLGFAARPEVHCAPWGHGMLLNCTVWVSQLRHIPIQLFWREKCAVLAHPWVSSGLPKEQGGLQGAAHPCAPSVALSVAPVAHSELPNRQILPVARMV